MRMCAGWPRLIILLVCFGIGVISGIAFAHFLQPDTILTDYLLEYCAALKEHRIQSPFLSILWDCFRWPVFTILLGTTALGLIGIPILFAARGFLLAFSVSLFGQIMHADGIALAAVLFSVSLLLVLPTLFVLGYSGLNTALHRLPSKVFPGAGAYHAETYLACGGILVVSVALQWAVLPAALSAISYFLF